MLQVGIDIGGTNIKAGIVDDETGKILVKRSIPFLHGGYEKNCAAIAALVLAMEEELPAENKMFCSVGIAVPGSINQAEGIVINAHNLGFHNAPIRDEIAKYFPDKPIFLSNDANAAVLAELCAGVFRGKNTAVLITIGTGTGGGLVLNGRVFNGGMDRGVELGHMVLKHGGLPCTCGNCGCVESYCTATWLAARGIEAAESARIRGQSSMILKLAGGLAERVDAKIVIDAAKAGDLAAQEIFAQFADHLSSALASICALLDPEVIAVGGGVSHAGDFLFQTLCAQLKEKSFYKADYLVVPAALGNDAGIVGAAMLYRS